MSLPRVGPTCAAPTFALTIPADLHPDSADVVLADGPYTRTFPLGDALVARSIAAIGHTDLTFEVGEPITVRWSHVADFARLSAVDVSFAPATGIAVTHTIPDEAITRDADTLTFTPDAEPGPARLTVELAGALADDVKVRQAAYLDITFVAP